MKQKYKVLGSGLAAIVMSLGMAGRAMAWGPERQTYTMEKPADRAVFNSIIDNAAVGDERDFVRIAEAGSGREFTSELILEPGKEYEVWIYYHNDASESYNTAAHDYVGLARNTRMISYYPEALAKGERGKIEGYITSTSTDPKTIWDEAYITAKEALTISYVEGSAHIYNKWDANKTELGKELFTSDGVWLGVNKLNGLVLGCDQFAGTVIYNIRTKAVEQPPVDPEPEPEPEDPTPENPDEPTPEIPEEKPEEVPEELPTTGPAEVALAVVVVLAIVAGGVYWYKTHKAVKKATKRAKGRK